MKKKFAGGRAAIVRLLLTSILLALGAGQALAETIFADNFTGPSLNSAWQVLPGQGVYVFGGGLRYYNQGPLSSPSGWSTTSLALALPFMGTNWEIDTRATYSLDWCTLGNSYTGPAVPNQSCSSGAQRPQIMVAFDPATASDRSALTGANVAEIDRGIDAWYGDDHLSASYGDVVASGLLNPADSTINKNIAGGAYWYRIVRSGGNLTMSYSTDGVSYATALSAQLNNPTGSYNELVLTGTTFLTENSFTDYGYVNIESLGTSAVPEPSGFALMLLGVAFVGVGRLRLKPGEPRHP